MECCDNIHDSVCNLRNWYVHDLLRALCVVNVGLQDHFINHFISELLKELHGLWDCMIFIVPLANNHNVLVGGFPRNVHLDFVIFLDVLHLRATLAHKVAVQSIPRELRQGAPLRRGVTSQCC